MATTKAIQITSIEVLENLINVVSTKYPTDPSKPSVTVSLIGPGQFYASIVRYGSSYGKDKYVVVSARADSLVKAIAMLAHEWLKHGTEQKVG